MLSIHLKIKISIGKKNILKEIMISLKKYNSGTNKH